MFIFQYIRIIKAQDVIYQTKDQIFYKCRKNTTDFGILNEVLILNEYNQYSNELTSDSCIVDFGAQGGSFSIFMAHQLNAKVFSFEPEPNNYRLLLENISLNKLSTLVTSFNYAISNQTKKDVLYLSNNQNQGIHSRFKTTSNQIEINCISVRKVLELVDLPIDLLKVDIEGSEHEILNLKSDFFFKHVKRIILEYHAQNHFSNTQSLEHIINTIHELGFNIDKIKGNPEIGIIADQKKV